MSALLNRFHSRPALLCVVLAHAAVAWAIAQAGVLPRPVLPQPVEVMLLPDLVPQPLPQTDAPAVSTPDAPRVASAPRVPSAPHVPSAPRVLSASDAPSAPSEPPRAPSPAPPPGSMPQPASITVSEPVPAPLQQQEPIDADAATERPIAMAAAAPAAAVPDAPMQPVPPVPMQPDPPAPAPALAPAPTVRASARARDATAVDTPDADADLPSYSAAYLRNPKPDYPPLSKRLGEQGVVTLRVFVSADGNPQDVQLKVSSGFGRLDHAAQDAVKRWRFTPAQRGDQAVAAWVLVPIRFSLRG